MVYVKRLTEFVEKIKRKGYDLQSFDDGKTIYKIFAPGTDVTVGEIICKKNNVIGYNAHIEQLMAEFIEPEKINAGDDALAAIED